MAKRKTSRNAAQAAANRKLWDYLKNVPNLGKGIGSVQNVLSMLLPDDSERTAFERGRKRR